MSDDVLVIRERVLERVVIADEVLVVSTPATTGPIGLTGPQGIPGTQAAAEDLALMVEAQINEYDEEGPSLVLLYENAKV